jgi:putative GTP pyrophosphokinase
MKYSKTQLNKAGLVLKDRNKNSINEISVSEDILTYYRYIHLPAINTMQSLLNKRIVRTFSKKGFVSQRLKRAPSIVSKLTRFPNMKLSTMQDIAGVRAVMNSLTDTLSLAKLVESTSAKHKIISLNDYIFAPKPSGYRSIHLVFEYSNKKKLESDGLRIELQIRSQLQHTWATAVETMGTFLNTSLKSSEGEKEILDFFALTSSAFAYIESCSLVPQFAHLTRQETYRQVIAEFKRLKIRDKLSAYTVVTEHITKNMEDEKYYLVTLDLKNKSVKLNKYTQKNLGQATIDYTQAERHINAGAEMQVVLISLESITSLKKAYPNYFLDTKDFIKKIEFIENKITSLQQTDLQKHSVSK